MYVIVYVHFVGILKL